MKFSLPAVLGILFIVLKLTKVIAWSWIWVLCPFWIPLAISVIILIITLLLAGTVIKFK